MLLLKGSQTKGDLSSRYEGACSGKKSGLNKRQVLSHQGMKGHVPVKVVLNEA